MLSTSNHNSDDLHAKGKERNCDESHVSIACRNEDYQFVQTDSSHKCNMLKSLYDCYKKELYCDIVVTVGDKIFKTHRFVLAMVSEYFRDLIQKMGNRMDGITLQENSVKSESFEYILEFTYTGNVDFSNSDIETLQNLVIACDYLGIAVLKGFCEKYVATVVSTENVLRLFVFSDRHDMSYLHVVTKNLFKREFLVLSETNEFLKLPLHLLLKFFGDNNLAIYKRRDCVIPPKHREREKLILAAVLRFINQNISNESMSWKNLAKLLECVKLLEFNKEYLQKQLVRFPDLKKNWYINEVFDLAISYKKRFNSPPPREFWKTARKTPYRFINSSSIACSDVIGDREMKWFCEDENKLKPTSCLTRISLWIGSFDNSPIIGALEFENDMGVVSAGGRDACYEKHDIALRRGEVITDVTVRSKVMIHSLKFTTNLGNVYGPFGCEKGKIRKCTPNTKYMRFLHSFKGVSLRTFEEDISIAHLSFRWVTFDERCMGVKNEDFW